MLITPLTSADLRQTDPFIQALKALFATFAARLDTPLGTLQGYLAGGLAVRCHAGSRSTGDIRMFFTGSRLLVPPNTAVTVGDGHVLFFDHQYTPEFGLLHPDYAERAVDLTSSAQGLPIRVLHPVDLAITKIARFEDHDRADIAALAATGTFDADALLVLAGEALGYAVGDPTFVRINLDDAVQIVRDRQP